MPTQHGVEVSATISVHLRGGVPRAFWRVVARVVTTTLPAGIGGIIVWLIMHQPIR